MLACSMSATYGAVADDKTDNTAVFGMIVNFPLQEKTTIVKCLTESGAAVISVGKALNSLYAGFSTGYLVVRNLE